MRRVQMYPNRLVCASELVNCDRRPSLVQKKKFHHAPRRLQDPLETSKHARKLDENITREEEEDYDRRVALDKEKQFRTPWQREGRLYDMALACQDAHVYAIQVQTSHRYRATGLQEQ